MVWFIPVIPAVDPGPDGSGGSLLGMLLTVNLFFNAIPCVLTALALWQTAKRRGIVRPWLALIPLADLWVLGSLSDRHNQKVWNKDKKMRKILPLLGAAALAVSLLPEGAACLGLPGVIPLVIAAVCIWGVFLVLRFGALCHLYEGYALKNPGLYIALSLLCPPLIPLFIFKCHW